MIGFHSLQNGFIPDDQRHLLYLFGVNKNPTNDKTNVVCQSIPNVNPLYVKIKGHAGYEQALREAMERDKELGIIGKYYPSSSESETYSIGDTSRRTGDSYGSSSYG